MTNYFKTNIKKTRLTKKEEQRAYRRLILLILLLLGVLILFIFWGIPLLLNLSSLLIAVNESNQQVVKKDELAPFSPFLEQLPEATSSAKITLKGYSEPGATIEIQLNSISYSSIVSDAEGKFQSSIVLQAGENTITSTASDQAGNTSQESTPLIISYDNQPPVLEIAEPTDGMRVGSRSKEVIVSGKTDVGSSLTVNDRLVVLGNNGEFRYAYPLTSGENVLHIVSTDKAGNKTEKTLKVTKD
ncbi:MAG TPA: Ig-like domain-containing protein [Patescibacteria group bacterium]|nr:Ig-like domain-containing protein [Patescibacteria group bacterium]